MCIIALTLEPETWPTEEQLTVCVQRNPDGFGWAAVVGDRVEIGKTMDPNEGIQSFLGLRTRASGPALFHARLATHGVRGVENCHPFGVGGRGDVVLAHNGILPVEPPPFDWRSDSAYFAEEMLAKWLPTLDQEGGMDAWAQWMGPANKVVVLSTASVLASPVYILNEGEGVWDDGIWWSNTGYRSFPAVVDRWRISGRRGKCDSVAEVPDAIPIDKVGTCVWCGDDDVELYELDEFPLDEVCRECVMFAWRQYDEALDV